MRELFNLQAAPLTGEIMLQDEPPHNRSGRFFPLPAIIIPAVLGTLTGPAVTGGVLAGTSAVLGVATAIDQHLKGHHGGDAADNQSG